MTALWIILGIVLFFALLLFVPVHVAAKYDDSLALRIRYLFISLKFPKPPLSPEQEAKKAEKKRKKQQKKQAKKQKKEEKRRKKAAKKGDKDHLFGEKKKKFDFKEIFARHGVSGLISILKDALRLLKKHLKKLRHMKISYLSIDLVIAKGNAADTAIEYGKTCAAVYPAVSELLSICRHGPYELAVSPDFNGQKSVAKAEIRLSIRLFHLVSLALGIVFGAIAIYLRFRKGKYEKKKKPEEKPDDNNTKQIQNTEIQKGGAVNEQSD